MDKNIKKALDLLEQYEQNEHNKTDDVHWVEDSNEKALAKWRERRIEDSKFKDSSDNAQLNNYNNNSHFANAVLSTVFKSIKLKL